MPTAENVLRNFNKSRPQIQTPISADMFLPNHSGITTHPEMQVIAANHPHQNVNTTASPTFADLIVTAGGDIKPSANSTTAINIAQADGTNFVTFDTTNKRVAINGTATTAHDLIIGADATGSRGIKLHSGFTGASAILATTAGGNTALTSTYALTLIASGDVMELKTTASKNINFYTNNTLRATIAADGNLDLVGGIDTYKNIATEGYGIPAIVDYIGLAGLNANITATNMTNTNVAGLYRVSYYLETTTTDALAGIIDIQIAWTDDSGATTSTSTNVLLNAASRATGTIFIKNTAAYITYRIALNAGAYLNSFYAYYVTAERLN